MTPTNSHAAAGHSSRGSARPLRVALVNMPFSSTRLPSIQLGLLQALLMRRGIPATTHYLNLRFGVRLGWETYERLCESGSPLLGEWLFSRAAFRDRAPAPTPFLHRVTPSLDAICEDLGCGREFLLDLRERVAPAFIEECLELVPWDAYDVAAFSSVFEQNVAALALARRLKERHPRLITVFGGANFEDEMGLEYVRAIPWIDYAVIGEGDETFPALLERLAAGDEIVDLPGVACRRDGAVQFSGRASQVQDLDALPEPEYGEFFAAAAELELPRLVQNSEVKLLFESARGCWWGAKHHCTFCGLNGLGMAYRSKSPARLLAGLDELAGRYGHYDFQAVDNILDLRYIHEVFDVLAERRTDYTFFYEVKANLTREQVRALARGGVRVIQPGIESLNTHVLALMRKGVRAIQNVRLLKWAHYYGLQTPWNVLLGFPGELAEDYERQLAVMQLIPHLTPPETCGRIWLERFSPFFGSAETLGIRNIRPNVAYAWIYPAGLNLERLAYFFDYDAPDTLPAEAYKPVQEQVRRWRAAWKEPRRPYLAYLRGAGRLTIMDGRCLEAPKAEVFDEAAALAYEYCSPTDHGAAQVQDHLRERGLAADAGDVQQILERFVAGGYMLEEDGHYLSLALPVNPNW